MKSFIGIIFLIGSAALASPLSSRTMTFSQSLYLDLSDVSNSLFTSRIRIHLTETYNSPDEIKTVQSDPVDDLGFQRHEELMIVQGSNLFESLIEIDEVDGAGHILRNISHSRKTTTTFVTSIPSMTNFFPTPVIRPNAPLTFDPIQMLDRSGQRLLVTLDAKIQPTFYFDPKFRIYIPLHEPAVEISASFAALTGRDLYSKGPLFKVLDQAVPDSMVKPKQCETSGEDLEISPLIFGNGLFAKRVQRCFTSTTGRVQRSIFIKENPPHEPEDGARRVLEAALRRGGALATSPIFPLENISFANCHGYALLATLGRASLPLNAYWIQAVKPSLYTLGSQTLEPILLAHFKKVLSLPASYFKTDSEERLAHDPRLRKGDFITFTSESGPAHSGVIRKNHSDGAWWIESKFEEGSILETPILSIHDVIPNLYSEIQIWRRSN